MITLTYNGYRLWFRKCDAATFARAFALRVAMARRA
jgi:hypothetical protein